MLDPAVEFARAAQAAAVGAERMRSAVAAAQAGKSAASQMAAAAARGSLMDAATALGGAVAAARGLDRSSLPPQMAGKLGRALGALDAAESRIGTHIEQARRAGQIGAAVIATVGPAAGSLGGALEAGRRQVSMLAASAASAVKGAYATVTDRLTGKPTAVPVAASLAAPAAALPASGAQAHLLVLSAEDGQRYYFGLSTAAYDSLKRDTSYNVAAQERLQREEALQAVNKGGESITVSGTVYTSRSGARQLDELRRLGRAQKPMQLTTGYGDVLGRWYLTKVSEDQGGLMSGGAPRKQQFTLEFRRYGDDFANG